jgi:hypothetical protein
MYLNLINVDYKDYKVDFNKFKLYLEYVYQIHDYALKNKLELTLIGHISLILLSRKIYRTPEDIDILTSLKDLNKWADFFKEDWEWDIRHREIAGRFVRNELQKFASTNIDTCSIIEDSADIYKINDNNFSLFKGSKSSNQINTKIPEQPEFVYHDPSKKTHNNNNFIEYNDNKFKIWFYTNNLARSFKSYIIFYDQNLIRKEFIECSFQYDYIKDNTTYAYWCSPEIDLNTFKKSYYRIFVHKEMFGLKLRNRTTRILLECYIYKNLLDLYNIPITYIDNCSIYDERFDFLLNGKSIQIKYPDKIFKEKFGREKDLDDYEVYKDLLHQYPLTNQ